MTDFLDNSHRSNSFFEDDLFQILNNELDPANPDNFNNNNHDNNVQESRSKSPEELNIKWKKPFYHVLIFGVCFFFLRSTFLTPSYMTPQIFEFEHYDNLGQIEIMFIYGFYGISSLFHTTLLQRLPLKFCLILGGLSFPIFNLASFYAMHCVDNMSPYCQYSLVYAINILCSMITGSLMGLLWTVQSEFVSMIAPVEKIGLFMGVFYAFAQGSQLLSTILSLVLLLNVSRKNYYFILFCIGVFFIIGLLFVPVKKRQKVNFLQEGSLITQEKKIKTKTLISNFRAILNLLKLKRIRLVSIFWMSTGLIVAFYSAFFYTIIKETLYNPTDSTQSFPNEEKDFIVKKASYVFLLFGFSEVFGGLFSIYLIHRFPIYICALFGLSMLEISVFITYQAHYNYNYSICFVAAFFWGFSDCLIRSLSNVLCKNEIKKKNGMAGFSLYRLFFGFGAILVVSFGIILKENKGFFLFGVFAMQMLAVFSIGCLLWDEKDPKQLIK